MSSPADPNGMLDVDLGDFETLEQFIIEQEDRFPHSTGAFSRLLRDISLAAKIVNRDMRRAGLIDIYGDTGETNVQGEVQKKMDALAHREFVLALRRGGECCLIGSEEHAEAIPLSTNSEGDGKYIVLLDPLDGSSNIDVNVSVGTIFSIYRLPDGYDQHKPEPDAALQPGTEQVAAVHHARLHNRERRERLYAGPIDWRVSTFTPADQDARSRSHFLGEQRVLPCL